MLEFILFPLLAYLVGSIASAVIVSRILGLPDPRTAGSHNPGATNVLRLGGKKAGIATLIGDLLKGFIPICLAIQFHVAPNLVSALMLAIFLGHLYPIFFKFKGGKGVATAMGVLLALDWRLGLGLVLLWSLVVYLSRLSSLGALIAAIVAPFYVAYLYPIPEYIIVTTLMSGFLLWRHRANMVRLWRGIEPKLGNKTS